MTTPNEGRGQGGRSSDKPADKSAFDGGTGEREKGKREPDVDETPGGTPTGERPRVGTGEPTTGGAGSRERSGVGDADRASRENPSRRGGPGHTGGRSNDEEGEEISERAGGE